MAKTEQSESRRPGRTAKLIHYDTSDLRKVERLATKAGLTRTAYLRMVLKKALTVNIEQMQADLAAAHRYIGDLEAEVKLLRRG